VIRKKKKKNPQQKKNNQKIVKIYIFGFKKICF